MQETLPLSPRRRTRTVRVGAVGVGGDNPVRVQSMTNTDTRDVDATLAQIEALAGAGCEIVRLAVLDEAAAKALAAIRAATAVPLVADIHFDHRLAVAALGGDESRMDPVLDPMTKQIKLPMGLAGHAQQALDLSRFDHSYLP